jgi:hypothetical protein
MKHELKATLKVCEEAYYFYSRKASDVARQLSFAGIAIVWMFKPGNNLNLVMPHNLLIPLFFFSLSLFFDLLHYIYSTVVWGCFHRIEEKKGKEPEAELTIPPWFNWPSITLFSLKLLFVIVGYFCVFIFFISKQ